jgi:hypothetical protein
MGGAPEGEASRSVRSCLHHQIVIGTEVGMLAGKKHRHGRLPGVVDMP